MFRKLFVNSEKTLDFLEEIVSIAPDPAPPKATANSGAVPAKKRVKKESDAPAKVPSSKPAAPKAPRVRKAKPKAEKGYADDDEEDDGDDDDEEKEEKVPEPKATNDDNIVLSGGLAVYQNNNASLMPKVELDEDYDEED